MVPVSAQQTATHAFGIAWLLGVGGLGPAGFPGSPAQGLAKLPSGCPQGAGPPGRRPFFSRFIQLMAGSVSLHLMCIPKAHGTCSSKASGGRGRLRPCDPLSRGSPDEARTTLVITLDDCLDQSAAEGLALRAPCLVLQGGSLLGLARVARRKLTPRRCSGWTQPPLATSAGS